MKKIKPSLMVLAATGLLFAQSASRPVQADSTVPTVEELLDKAVTAYGGADRLRNLDQNCAWLGTITFGGLDGRSYTYKQVRRGLHWRTDVEAASANDRSGLKITAYDGQSLWQTDARGSDYLKPEQASVLIQDYERQPSILAQWRQPDYQFKLVGSASFHDVPAWQIEETKTGEAPNEIYLDKGNFLVLGISYAVGGGDGKPSHGEKQFSENRPALGTVYPFRQRQVIDGSSVYDLSLANVSSADDVPDHYFFKPGTQSQVRLSKSFTVPFDYSQKEIVCRGKIEDHDGLFFLFDTGSSDTIIDRRLAAQLLLSRGMDYRIKAFGGDISTQSSKIDRLELGNMIINDVDAKILDLSGQSKQLGKNITGIIGMNVISNYLVTIDYGKATITFEDRTSAERPADSGIPFGSLSTPTIKAYLGGDDPEEFLMDTGAAFNHISYDVARRHVPKDGGIGRHLVEGTGLDGKPVQLATLVIDPVTLGGEKARRVSFTYPTTPPDPRRAGNFTGGLDKSQLGILGNPFWQNFTVIIDSKFQRIILKPNPNGASRGDFDTVVANGDLALITKRDFRAAELAYQRASIIADNSHDPRYQALALGRLGNLRRLMAHDLQRPEHARAAYGYFTRAEELARKSDLKDVQGRILGDWSLLYSDNGQPEEAKQTAAQAIMLAPQDANVNVDYAVHLFRARSYVEAQQYIEKALFLDPSNWQALWYQVKLSETFIDAAKEKQSLGEILRYYPWSKVAADKLKMINPFGQQPSPSAAH